MYTAYNNNKYKRKEKWYEHEPQTVTERDNITILWDMPIQTDREIKAIKGIGVMSA